MCIRDRLNNENKILGSYATTGLGGTDHGGFGFGFVPKDDSQSFDEAENLILEEIKKVKSGDFSEDLIQSGLDKRIIITDPGIGFGKLLEHNLSLLSAGKEIVAHESMSLMWGVSRKKMFEDLLGRNEIKNRLAGTLGVAAMAPKKGVDIIRVHDVREHYDLYTSMASLE